MKKSIFRVPELQIKCKELKIRGYSGKRKNELIQLIVDNVNNKESTNKIKIYDCLSSK